MAPLNEHPLDLTQRERFRESFKGPFVGHYLLKKRERCANSCRVANVFRPGAANRVLERDKAAPKKNSFSIVSKLGSGSLSTPYSL
jgi:hypothetical protein